MDYQKAVLTFDEACTYAGMSKSHFYKLTSAGKIPFYKPNGKMIYFDRLELETWLKRNRSKSHDEIQQEAINKVVLNSKN